MAAGTETDRERIERILHSASTQVEEAQRALVELTRREEEEQREAAAEAEAEAEVEAEAEAEAAEEERWREERRQWEAAAEERISRTVEAAIAVQACNPSFGGRGRTHPRSPACPPPAPQPPTHTSHPTAQVQQQLTHRAAGEVAVAQGLQMELEEQQQTHRGALAQLCETPTTLCHQAVTPRVPGEVEQLSETCKFEVGEMRREVR